MLMVACLEMTSGERAWRCSRSTSTSGIKASSARRLATVWTAVESFCAEPWADEEAARWSSSSSVSEPASERGARCDCWSGEGAAMAGSGDARCTWAVLLGGSSGRDARRRRAEGEATTWSDSSHSSTASFSLSQPSVALCNPALPASTL